MSPALSKRHTAVETPYLARSEWEFEKTQSSKIKIVQKKSLLLRNNLMSSV